MNVFLTEKHFKKLAVITELPLEEVTKLSAMGLIDANRAVELLMQYDWKLLMRNDTQYTAQQRICAIMNEYNATEHRVREAVYKKRSMPYYCRECGHVIIKRVYDRNNGLCDKCVIKSIKLPVQ